jgi:hypothetical protein
LSTGSDDWKIGKRGSRRIPETAKVGDGTERAAVLEQRIKDVEEGKLELERRLADAFAR